MEYFKLVIYFVNTKLVRFVISKQQVVYSFKIMEYFLSLIKILSYFENILFTNFKKGYKKNSKLQNFFTTMKICMIFCIF